MPSEKREYGGVQLLLEEVWRGRAVLHPPLLDRLNLLLGDQCELDFRGRPF